MHLGGVDGKSSLNSIRNWKPIAFYTESREEAKMLVIFGRSIKGNQ